MYQPNFNDKRVIALTIQIINWVEKNIGADTCTLHSKILRSPQAFGDSPAGRYIKKCLLIKTNPAYIPGKMSNQYRLNIDYLNRLRKKLNLPESELKHNRVEQRFAQQQESIESGDFEYNETGGRWYNGLQNIKREEKAPMWAKRGYVYDYDVECCAPTVLLQQAQKLNPKMKSVDYINFYLANKKLVRDEISIKYNLSSAQVKQVLNGLFQGGVLNLYKENKILHHLNRDTYKMRSLMNDEFLKSLTDDIKVMWDSIRDDIDTGHHYRGDIRRRNRITGKHKSDYYKVLEGYVMKPIWKYLKKRKIDVFREHDGFKSTGFVIPNELEQVVLSETGFQVKFNWNKIESTDYDE